MKSQIRHFSFNFAKVLRRACIKLGHWSLFVVLKQVVAKTPLLQWQRWESPHARKKAISMATEGQKQVSFKSEMKGFLLALILAHLGSAAKIGQVCGGKDKCQGRNQVCTEFRKCECSPNTMLFAGDCVGSRNHGDRCLFQIECSMTGDPNLHCNNGRCGCRRGTHYHGGKCQGSEFGLKKMDPSGDKGIVKLHSQYDHIDGVEWVSTNPERNQAFLWVLTVQIV